MPTIIKYKGYRFFFYVNDHFPPHIHVEKDNCTAKFKLEPTELIKSKRFKSEELTEIRKFVIDKKDFFIKKWNEYFNNK